MQDPLTNIDMVHPNFISKHFSADNEREVMASKSPMKVPMSTNAREFMPSKTYSNDQYDDLKNHIETQYGYS